MRGRYQDLIVWQKATELGLALYDQTESFPDHEKYGLISQLRRGGVSVASNVAEGQGRRTRGEFLQFLGTSRGALMEVETQLYFALRRGYLSTPQYADLLKASTEVARLLSGLMKSLEKTAPRSKI